MTTVDNQDIAPVPVSNIEFGTIPLPAKYANMARILPYGSFPGYQVVSKEFPLLKPGKYMLNVSVRLGSGYIGDEVPAPRLPRLLVQDFSFPLTVQAANQNRLQQVAQDLAKALLAKPAFTEKKMLVDALFSMPDTVTAP